MTYCSEWLKNPLINPKTGRAIKRDGPTYKKLQKECEDQACDKWEDNPRINPFTGRQISRSGPTYKKLVNSCSDICERWFDDKLINPETNRKIKVDGPTYKKLGEQCVEFPPEDVPVSYKELTRVESSTDDPETLLMSSKGIQVSMSREELSLKKEDYKKYVNLTYKNKHDKTRIERIIGIDKPIYSFDQMYKVILLRQQDNRECGQYGNESACDADIFFDHNFPIASKLAETPGMMKIKEPGVARNDDEFFPKYQEVYWYILNNSPNGALRQMLYTRLIEDITLPLQTESVTVNWDVRAELMAKAAEYAAEMYPDDPIYFKIFFDIFLYGNRHIEDGETELAVWKEELSQIPLTKEQLFEWWWDWWERWKGGRVDNTEKEELRQIAFSGRPMTVEDEADDNLIDFFESAGGLMLLIKALKPIPKSSHIVSPTFSPAFVEPEEVSATAEGGDLVITSGEQPKALSIFSPTEKQHRVGFSPSHPEAQLPEGATPENWVNIRLKQSKHLGSIISRGIKDRLDVCMSGDRVTFRENFAVTKTIGKGTFGQIYKAQLETGAEKTWIVVKEAFLHESQRNVVKDKRLTNAAHPSEFKILKMVRTLLNDKHTPNFPYTYGMSICDGCTINNMRGITRTGSCYTTFMELEGGDMTGLINTSNSALQRSLLYQMLIAVHCMHEKYGIVHNDIKMPNILIRKVPADKDYFKYVVDGTIFMVPNEGYIALISDFGMAEAMSPAYATSKYYGQRNAEVKEGPNGKLYFDPIVCKHFALFPTYDSIPIMFEEPQEYDWVDSVGTINNFGAMTSGLEPDRPINLEDTMRFPPFDFANDVIDTVRIFTGGGRTCECGTHISLRKLDKHLEAILGKYGDYTGMGIDDVRFILAKEMLRLVYEKPIGPVRSYQTFEC